MLLFLFLELVLIFVAVAFKAWLIEICHRGVTASLSVGTCLVLAMQTLAFANAHYKAAINKIGIAINSARMIPKNPRIPIKKNPPTTKNSTKRSTSMTFFNFLCFLVFPENWIRDACHQDSVVADDRKVGREVSSPYRVNALKESICAHELSFHAKSGEQAVGSGSSHRFRQRIVSFRLAHYGLTLGGSNEPE